MIIISYLPIGESETKCYFIPVSRGKILLVEKSFFKLEYLRICECSPRLSFLLVLQIFLPAKLLRSLKFWNSSMLIIAVPHYIITTRITV